MPRPAEASTKVGSHLSWFTRSGLDLCVHSSPKNEVRGGHYEQRPPSPGHRTAWLDRAIRTSRACSPESTEAAGG